jgi:hypothetical protein
MNTRTKTKSTPQGAFCFGMGTGSNRSNAARMSAAGEGGALRSKFEILMIAPGNHTMIQ